MFYYLCVILAFHTFFGIASQQHTCCTWQGYDIVATACPERYVVGLDISDIAIKKALEVRALSQKIPISLRLEIS
jgi:hypothetical protein